MPLELVFEILSYLHPIDLLNLARTNKSLRKFLMSRSLSENIWRAALKRRFFPTLPPIPSGFSEPAFVALLFNPICHACGQPSPSVIWSCKLSCHSSQSCIEKL
ncbi:hypothetical protein L218DRAFT_872714 [Marasmius fiardii PR-910]|nr:hypothetical protein L218DRAFT_872714 [Marasmius fiardii PR-910]